MHCAEFEALLFDAMDGVGAGTGKDETLAVGKLAKFRAHASGCATCGPFFADAQAGQQWLRSLAEVEPPRNLVHNILARTSGVEERHVQVAPGAKASGWRQGFGGLRPMFSGVFSGVWATVRQPRFGMSVAMAFFSVSLVMSVAGIKVTDLAKIDLRPGAIKRSYYSTQARVVKYYSNMRFVYEFESRLRDIRRATEPAESEPAKREAPKPKDNNKTSSRPSKGEDHNRERNQENYAQDDTLPVMAKAGEGGATDFEFWISANRREA